MVRVSQHAFPIRSVGASTGVQWAASEILTSPLGQVNPRRTSGCRSRLTRRFEQKTKKNLALNILGIVLIIFIVFKFGIPFLVNVSLFLSGSKNNQEQYFGNQRIRGASSK